EPPARLIGSTAVRRAAERCGLRVAAVVLYPHQLRIDVLPRGVSCRSERRHQRLVSPLLDFSVTGPRWVQSDRVMNETGREVLDARTRIDLRRSRCHRRPVARTGAALLRGGAEQLESINDVEDWELGVYLDARVPPTLARDALKRARMRSAREV